MFDKINKENIIKLFKLFLERYPSNSNDMKLKKQKIELFFIK